MKVTAPSAPAVRPLRELCQLARMCSCGECWAGPAVPCTRNPEGDHVARFNRAMRRGLISGPELVLVLNALPPFSTYTIVETPGGAS